MKSKKYLHEGKKWREKRNNQNKHNNKLFQVGWAMVQLASSRFLTWLTFLLSAIYTQGSSTVLFLVRCSAWSSSSHFGLKSSFYRQHCFKNFFMEMTRAMKATFIFSIIATNFYYLSFIEKVTALHSVNVVKSFCRDGSKMLDDSMATDLPCHFSL